MKDWFEGFFEEKELETMTWEIEDNKGNTHIITNEIVVEHIQASPEEEQRKIKDILVKIDFANGDVNHFLNHLAKAIVNNY